MALEPYTMLGDLRATCSASGNRPQLELEMLTRFYKYYQEACVLVRFHR